MRKIVTVSLFKGTSQVYISWCLFHLSTTLHDHYNLYNILKPNLLNLNSFIFEIFFLRENAPGQQECDQAADTINRSINKIDQASLAAISNNLKPTTEDSLKVGVRHVNYSKVFLNKFCVDR